MQIKTLGAKNNNYKTYEFGTKNSQLNIIFKRTDTVYAHKSIYYSLCQLYNLNKIITK